MLQNGKIKLLSGEARTMGNTMLILSILFKSETRKCLFGFIGF